MVNSKEINEINSLIVAQLAAEKNKTAIPIAKIERDYREETGERIPYAKLGFPKLVDYLKTVPGVEVIEMYNAHYVNFMGTEDSQHIVDLVSKQRYKNPPRNARRYTGYTKNSSNSYGSRSYGSLTRTNRNITDNILSILRRYSNGLTRTELLQKLNYECALDENLTTLNDYLKILGKQITIRDKLIYENIRKKSDDSHNSGYYRCDQVDSTRFNHYDANYQSTYTNNKTRSNPMKEDLDYNGFIDLETNQFCVTENDLLHEIKASDCNNHYNSVEEEHRMNYSDMAKLHQQNITHETLLCSDNSENIIDTTNRREYIFSQNKDYVSTALSKRVKFRLEKLIQSRPQGIWCTELPKLYEEEYKIPLEWTNLGFHRLSDFTAHLSDIFHVIGPQLNGDFKLYNAKEPVPDDKPSKIPKKLTTASLFDIYGDVDIEPIPTSVPASFSKQLCPDDVITIQETVGQVLVTDLKISNNVDKNENPMVEVEVVEAYSPSFFWIRLLKNKNKFNKMMRSLGEFYDSNYQKYAVPIIMLERGLNIACVFYGKWHRAIIKSVDPNCRVTVLFYDYGTVDKYPSNEIFYLHRSFTALPAQAVPCGLYSVAPHEGDKWPKRVRDWFTQWVCERPLWANIVEIDAERNSMLVTLADTSGKDDFFINDWLIDKKMAKVKRMVRIRLKNFLYERYLQCGNIGKSLNIQVVDDQNTCSIPTYHELTSKSPLSRRMSLLQKLCNVSNHFESNNKTNVQDICPTCGNCTTKFIEQKSKTDNNRETSFDKVISWLKKNRMQQVKNIEDMNLYVDDLCEYYAEENGVIETIIPTTRRPESNGGMISFINKSPKSFSSLNNKLELYKYDWKAYKSQIRKKIDEFIMLTMRLYHDFVKNNMGSAAHGIIQNFVGESLTDSMLELIFSFMDLDPQEIFTDNINALALSNGFSANKENHSNVGESKQVAITSESIKMNNLVLKDKSASNSTDINNNSDKERSNADVSNPVSLTTEIEIKRSKLETSIKEVAKKFFEDRNIIDSKNLVEKKLNPFTESFHDTNPFKKNLSINGISKKNTTKPPPLPPRPLNMVSKRDCSETIFGSHQQNSSKIIYQSPPVMYSASKNSSRLDHSNKPCKNFCQRDKNCENIGLINGQTLAESSQNIHNENYSRSISSANPFKSPQFPMALRQIKNQEYPFMFEHFYNIRESCLEEDHTATDELVLVKLRFIFELLLRLGVINTYDLISLVINAPYIPLILIDICNMLTQAITFSYHFEELSKN
ncbi:uncharacterized protein [Chelonus insularis]|uniref:uncharacterized protein n=1 Tax=Chelonus insularis TaxID=460826 RepID=UPI00158CCAC5|nr:uncharacterized protein LOC118064268 [Chelonus insularis]